MTDTFIDLKNRWICLKILLKFLIEFQDLFFIRTASGLRPEQKMRK
jgi:hypothetical protein